MESWSEIRSLEDKAARLREKIAEPRTRLNIRDLNRAKVELQTTEELIKRDLKSRGLYNQIALASNNDYRRALAKPIARPPPRLAQQHEDVAPVSMDAATAPSTTTTTPDVTDNEVSRFLRDLTLPRPAVIDKRTLVYTDVCRCGAEMHRQPTMSFLICPVCSFKRIRVDMCPTDVAKTNFERAKGPGSGVAKTGNKNGAGQSGGRHAPKTASHYGGFLNMNRCRKTCRVDPARLEELFKFCYVEGARSPNDITHQLINLAQRHTARGVEYQMTRIYVSLLRNDRIIIPDAVKKDLVKLYLYMHPVYSKYKHDETKKSNMAKFSFVSRILCRLLGLDVLLPLFDNFTMAPIVMRRTSFMRRVFWRLGWEWCDEISDVPAVELDKFDAENGITDIPITDDTQDDVESEDEEELEEEEEEEEELEEQTPVKKGRVGKRKADDGDTSPQKRGCVRDLEVPADLFAE